MKRWGWCAASVMGLAAGCNDQVQQHGAVDAAIRMGDAASADAASADAVSNDANAPRDGAPSDASDAGVERLLGIDPEVRDAFDGRGAELGPEVEVGVVRWARGVQSIPRVRGQFVWVGSGVDANSAWAYPILTFTPTPDGRGTNRQFRWLNDAANYRPTQTRAGNNDTTFVVCSRDHWNGVPNTMQENGYCRLLMNAPQGPLELGSRRAPLGMTTGVEISSDVWDTNRWWVLAWGIQDTPQWRLHRIEDDLSHEPSPPVVRRQGCPIWGASVALPANEGWVMTSYLPTQCDDGHRVRIERVQLPDGRSIGEAIDLRFGEGAWANTEASANAIRMASDSEDGVVAMVDRQIQAREQNVDAYFIRAYRDGRWGARRVTGEGAALSWLVGTTRGEWVYGYIQPSEGSSPRRLMLLRLDGNGRRLAPPTEYARGLNVEPLGYGYEPDARALWLTYGVSTNSTTERHVYTVFLRRVALNPPPR